MGKLINAQDRFKIHEEKSIVEEMGDLKDFMERLNSGKTATAMISFEKQMQAMFGVSDER